MREGNYLTRNKCSPSVRVSSSFQASLSRNRPVKIQCSSVKTCRGSSVMLLSSKLALFCLNPFSLIALAGKYEHSNERSQSDWGSTFLWCCLLCSTGSSYF